MAQRRSVEVAFAYVAGLAPGVKANCWVLAEAAGHEGWHRMQSLLGSYQWDWQEVRGALAGLCAAWLPCDQDDLIGPGLAVDETAHLKRGTRLRRSLRSTVSISRRQRPVGTRPGLQTD